VTAGVNWLRLSWGQLRRRLGFFAAAACDLSAAASGEQEIVSGA